MEGPRAHREKLADFNLRQAFAGDPQRFAEFPALHTALRRPIGDKVLVDGVDVMPEVQRVLNRMSELVGRVHDGLWRGYTEERSLMW